MVMGESISGDEQICFSEDADVWVITFTGFLYRSGNLCRITPLAHSSFGNLKFTVLFALCASFIASRAEVSIVKGFFMTHFPSNFEKPKKPSQEGPFCAHAVKTFFILRCRKCMRSAMIGNFSRKKLWIHIIAI